jgi:uncharacterized protein YjbJ (UPF0337 family)
MDQDPVPSEAERVKGSVKEAIGKLTGDTRAQAEGRAEKARGKAPEEALGAEGTIPNVPAKQT